MSGDSPNRIPCRAPPWRWIRRSFSPGRGGRTPCWRWESRRRRWRCSSATSPWCRMDGRRKSTGRTPTRSRWPARPGRRARCSTPSGCGREGSSPRRGLSPPRWRSWEITRRRWSSSAGRSSGTIPGWCSSPRWRATTDCGRTRAPRRCSRSWGRADMGDVPVRLAAALADRYRLERELGQGGMATVHLAEDLKHHRKVAVKVLRPELAAALGPERFLREIETTANLRHPHILPLYDSGEAGGFLFYVMPLVEGESLRNRIEREKQLQIEAALAIAREVADALGYAHSRGIIHRDIKPENILLEGGHAVVADFGIARAVSAAGAEQLTRTGMSIGTPSYMSPEQASGEPTLDGRSDLYALGCVLYEMLGGQPPFTGPTVESVIHQHLMVEPPSITNLRPTVPAAVAGALARVLAKNPADRFHPAAQFVQAFASTGASITATATAHPKPSRSRTIPIGIGVAAGLLVVAAAGYLITRGTPAAAPLEPKRVVVATFENRSGDRSLDPLGAMAADWIARGLVGTGLVDVGGTAADLTARGIGSDAPAGSSAILALAR